MRLKSTRPLTLDWLWAKVTKTDSCWLWHAARLPTGYGFAKRLRKTLYAHRISWELHYGPIPNGHLVRHFVCDNPPCVRPDHLRLGTQRDNIRDMIGKRRGVQPDNSGVRHGNAKLTDASVRAIRTEYSAGDISQTELGKRYGVSQFAISRVVIGKGWTHV